MFTILENCVTAARGGGFVWLGDVHVNAAWEVTEATWLLPSLYTCGTGAESRGLRFENTLKIN